MKMPMIPFLLFLLVGTAVARPCKTIFYFSTITTAYYPHNSLSGNPTPKILFQNPSYLEFIFTATSTIGADSRYGNQLPTLDFDSENVEKEDSEIVTSSYLPVKFYSTVSNSIRERAKDIMSVVGALLFGVACGALTAAILYFVWALFSPRYFEIEEDSSSDDDDDDDIAAAKKFGYVAIPSKTKVVDDDLKKPAPVASEAV